MNIFSNIIFDIPNSNDEINIKNKVISLTDNSFIKNVFNSFKESEINNKYIFLKQKLDNTFMSDNDIENIMETFCKIQKIYFAFNKLAYIYKIKKAKIVVKDDLCLNPLDINKKNVICLYQINNKYLFNITDLINIINMCLSNSPSFFSEPLTIKNPYNNLPFNKSTLYNIYFFMRERTFILSELFHKFFLSNFDIYKFEENYDYLIRDYSIKNYVNNTCPDFLHIDIMQMIGYYNKLNLKKIIKIHKKFPKKRLVEIMKPYLKLYLLYKYSLVDMIKNNSRNLLLYKLIKFSEYNHSFSREIVEIKKTYVNLKYKKEVINKFNDRHINFYNPENNFMVSHIEKQTHTNYFIMNARVVSDEDSQYNTEDDETQDTATETDTTEDNETNTTLIENWNYNGDDSQIDQQLNNSPDIMNHTGLNRYLIEEGIEYNEDDDDVDDNDEDNTEEFDSVS